MILRLIWFAIALIAFVGQAYGIPIVALDTNADGKPDTAIVGHSGGIASLGQSSIPAPSVTNVLDIAAVDLDGDGYLEAAVIAGDRVVAVDAIGKKWEKEISGFSAMAADLNGDGRLNEVIIGGAAGNTQGLFAFDSKGNSLWNYTQNYDKPYFIARLKDRIVVGQGGTNKLLIAHAAANGLPLWSKVIQDNIAAMTAVDIDRTGELNGVVVVSFNGNATIIDKNGMEIGSTKKNHDQKTPIYIHALGRNTDRKMGIAAYNLDYGVYLLNLAPTGITSLVEINAQQYGFVAGLTKKTTIAPADFDGDGLMDDFIVASYNKDIGGGKMYAFNANRQLVGSSNETGAALLTVIDYNGDGKVNDAVAWDEASKSLFVISFAIQDSTTSAVPPPTPPPTVAPTTTPPPTTAAPTPPPTQAPVAQVMSVDLGQDQNVTEGAEVTLTPKATPSTTTGRIDKYLWTESETILGRNSTLTRRFSAGEHTVTLEVTDDRGKTATDTVKITVKSTAPEVLSVNIGPDLTVVEGTSITLTANVTPSRSDAQITSYLWVRDSTILGTTPLIAMALPAGSHTITLTVTESTGKTASDTALVNVLSKGVALPSFSIGDLRKYSGLIIWVVLGFIALMVLLFIREKILDFLWDRQKDYGE